MGAHGRTPSNMDGTGSLAAGLGLILAALPGLAQAHDQARRATTVSEVQVTGQSQGYVVEGSGVAKLPGILDTPQSITAISRAELDDRGVGALDDALRTAPGISLGAGEYSFQGSNVVIRGFTSRNDMFVDGMRDYGYYFRDTFNAEAVTVLKGPSSMVFGRGSTGGVINQVSKQPTPERALAATLAAGTDDTLRAAVDANMPLPDIAAGSALRVNLMGHQSQVAGRDRGESRRWGVAPTLALGLGTETRINLAWFHQSEDNRPDYGIPWFAGRPAKLDRTNFYGFAADYFDADVDIGTLAVERDFDAETGVRSQLRYSSARRDFRITEAQIPAGTPLTTPLSAITVNRLEFQGRSNDRFLQWQGDAHARRHVGGLTHDLRAGVEIGRERAAPDYVTHLGVPGANLATPDPAQAYSYQHRYLRLTARTRSVAQAAYIMDTVSLTERLQLMGGVRFERFTSRYLSTGYSSTGAVIAVSPVKRTDEAANWRAAVIYAPTTDANLYLTYGTSFNPSAEGIESLISAGRSLAQANVDLDPEESTSLEAGGKVRLFDGRALATVAVFQVEKTNVRVPDPTTPGFNMLGGEQRVRGFEAEMVGRVTTAIELRANYAYLDSETMKSAAGGPLVGERLTVTPRHSGAVWGTWKLTDRLRVGGGLRHVGARLGQNTAASFLRAPGYTAFDAMAEMRLSSQVSLKLNVYNLTDKLYYDQLHPFHVTIGAARSALLTLSWRGW